MSDVVIIGGGIIGLCAAEKLTSQGHTVTIIEKERIAAGASYGNAAGLAFSEVMPMASFSMILQSMRWILDPGGPFKIVPQDLPHTLPWLVRFALAARKSTYDRSLAVQSGLMKLGRSTLSRVLERTKLDNMVRSCGALYLYESPSEYAAAQPSWRLRAEQGIKYDCYEGPLLHDFQAGLSKEVYAGIHAPDYQCVTNPNDFCLAIHDHLTQVGVKTVYAKVVALRPQSDGVEVVLDIAPVIKASKVVVAAGPWSGELSKALGDPVPLTGERGYNTTLPKSAFPALERPLFFGRHGFVMSPLADGVRIGGASEIARLDRPADFRRSQALLRKARELVPGLQKVEGEQWMGRRPTTPDSLPVIGCSTQHPDVIYAFGHGHLGLTQSTATAQLVSELVAGQPSSIDLASLSARRF